MKRTPDLTSDLLKRVSRSFYLSLAVLPASVGPILGLAYLFARAADTIADSRLIDREQRITHLIAFRDELDSLAPGRLAAIVAATRGIQSLEAERTLLERLPECFAAYQALPVADRRRVRHVLETIIEGMTEDLSRFPGEDEDGLTALETRHDLDRYTYLVAGCVGEFWTEVHVAHRSRLKQWDLDKMKSLGIRFGKGLQLLNLALDHYEAGWQYTFAIPKRETRMRLACAWPLLIGLRTLDLLAQSPNWLDPDVVLKVPRFRVYGMMAQSMATVWSSRMLARKARQLRERIRL